MSYPADISACDTSRFGIAPQSGKSSGLAQGVAKNQPLDFSGLLCASPSLHYIASFCSCPVYILEPELSLSL